MSVAPTAYGFSWGPIKVTRMAHITQGKRENYCVSVNGVDIHVSKTGRSVRVFRDGKEPK